jgi:UDP-glucose 4-epimerase
VIDGPPTLVVGAGGLLGSHVVRAVPSAVAPPMSIPWRADPTAALGDLAVWLDRRSQRGPWRVTWCAGTGGVDTTADALAAETSALEHFLGALARSSRPTEGAFLFASSAGGVHGGSTEDPVTEHTPAAPMSPYGRAKLEQEELVRSWSVATGIPTVVARLSNLYGPGQRVRQGLVSRLVEASLRAQPLLLFVPLDTVRDYLYVTDAARKVGELIERAAAPRPSGDDGFTVKLVCSGQATTVGQLVAEVQRIRRRRTPVTFGATPATALQPRTLRFRSVVWTDVDRGGAVSLPEGIATVIRSQQRTAMAGAAG